MNTNSIYDPAIMEVVLGKIAEGWTLNEVCRSNPAFPHSGTIRQWIAADHDGLAAKYAAAKESQIDAWADAILDISDDTSGDTIYSEHGEREDREWVNRSKLRVDTRKWLMERLMPRKYGSKVQAEHSGSLTVKIVKFGDGDDE